MTLKMLVAACLLLIGCSGSTGPGGKALRAGTYGVSFTVPFSGDTPGGLIGDHELTFRVVDPVTEPSSFTLISSVKHTQLFSGEPLPDENDYLDPDNRSVIAGTLQWRLQWWYRGVSSLGVRLNMSEGESGNISLPFGCGGIRGEFENFRDFGCVVTRIE